MRKYTVILAGGVLVLCIGMLTLLYYPSDLTVVETLSPDPVILQQAQVTVSQSPEYAVFGIDDEHDGALELAKLALQQPMQDMISQQQSILNYPGYSQPYDHIGEAFVNWNRTYPVEIPVLEGDESMSLQLLRYHHVYPQAIEGRVSSSVNLNSVRIELVDVDSGIVLHSERGDGHFRVKSESGWPRNLRVRAEVNFMGGTEQLTTDLNFHYPSATIEAVSQAHVVKQNVVAEVTVNTDQAGIFRLRTILEDASGTRMAILTTRENLEQGRQTFQVRAHHSVLPDHPVELFLNIPVIERMSSHPGELATYGQSKKPRWPLGRVNPAMLDSEPYEPNESEQRQLEFLRGWGDKLGLTGTPLN